MVTTTNETRLRPKGRWWVSFALVACLVLGSAGAVWAGSQVARIDASAPVKGHHLAVSAKVVGGPLVPGYKRLLKVRVSNPFGYPVYVRSVKVTPKRTSVIGCQRTWFRATAFKADKRHRSVRVRGHHSAAIKLSITLRNLATVNQDACKGAKVRLALSAKASKRR